MVFLKSLIILVYNLAWGFLIPFSIKCFLFFPEHRLFVSGKRIPLTPGFFYRKKERLIHKLNSLLDGYLNACRSDDTSTKIAYWERQAFNKTWDSMEGIEKARLIPKVIRDWIRHFFAMLVFELVKQFLRSFIPYLMDHYKIKNCLLLVEQKIDMKVIKNYYNKYIYKFMLYFFLGLNLFIGLGNMIIFLIIH